MATASEPKGRVCVGVIAGPHGVRGLVKITSFTEDPAAVTAYGDPTDASGVRSFRITLQSRVKSQWIARIDGAADRDAAERLRGVRLYVDRAALPPPEDAEEFYHADLIGLRAEAVDGSPVGTVRALYDFGAGDMVEIARPGAAALMLPFTRAAVPVIDLPGRRIVVDPPAEAGPEADDTIAASGSTPREPGA